ncbi:MAG: cell division topological specificity factor MinE [Candidatus Eremiobacteraeota bacterium]|nr:cell division topological specificity factor MinE [Candidatus Eremiobacteraeota bacterium]
MIEFFNKLFGRQPSGATAKERLRLVLMSDHLSLAPDMVEAMKRDLVDVISRYVEVDRAKIEVSFEQQDKALAMLANIPILSVNRNGGGGKAEMPPAAGATVTPKKRRRKRSAANSAPKPDLNGAPA